MSLIERLHPADTTETSTYMLRRYRSGVEALRGRRLAVGMIARNCGRTLGRTLDVVDAVGMHAGDCRVHVVTNDNTDDTVDVLAGRTQPPGVSLGWDEFSLGRPFLGGSRSAGRTTALAEYRNDVKVSLPSDADYVLILDADLHEVTPYRLLAGLGDMVTMCWHAIAAQNLVHLPEFEPDWLISYDAFAFRPEWGDRTNAMIERAFHYDVRPSGTRPYRVGSAFGGACWYAGRKFFEAGREYCGEHGCEHVPFHRDLVMGVSPSMSLIGFLGGGA